MIDRVPMKRLQRRFVGENLRQNSQVSDRLLSRKERDVSPGVELPERMDVHWDSRRKSKRTVNAGPNAPLLIRLVRYPYGMTATPMVHSPRFKRDSLPEREAFGEVARRFAEAWAKPQGHQPAKGRLRAQSPERATATTWISQRGAE